MKYSINIEFLPEQAVDDIYIKKVIAGKLNVNSQDIYDFRIIRRSIDARNKNIKVNLGIEAYIGEVPDVQKPDFKFENVERSKEVIIIGAGPAGLFAALKLIESGLKPVIFERGKDVSSRKRDIAAIHRNEGVNPDSNYGFGEGGAGTFSDGKLFTRSKKKGDIKRILELFYYHGAQEEILIDAHPHIGTNVLPGVIKKIRETILNSGGEIHYDSRVTDIDISGGRVTGIRLLNGETFKSDNIILSAGHSAKELYYMLFEKGIKLEAKSFAVGFRIEHPQSLIDSIQYHRNERGPYLPAATYSYVEQANGRGVYSFCMCPGGIIVPASTSNKELVVNGMSSSFRNGRFANSGIVTEVRVSDLKNYEKFGDLACLKFQEELEEKSFNLGGLTQNAPAQRLTDFLNNRVSSTLPETSYHPGLVSADLNMLFPDFIKVSLKAGLKQIGNKARGFVTDEAIVAGVESRTSSPVRIPRDNDTMEHIQIKGLYPCGEGAGYAGGIVSSAIDGEKCAEKICEKLKIK